MSHTGMDTSFIDQLGRLPPVILRQQSPGLITVFQSLREVALGIADITQERIGRREVLAQVRLTAGIQGPEGIMTGAVVLLQFDKPIGNVVQRNAAVKVIVERIGILQRPLRIDDLSIVESLFAVQHSDPRIGNVMLVEIAARFQESVTFQVTGDGLFGTPHGPGTCPA